MIEDRAERNKLRSIIFNAEDRETISKDEAGFVIALVEKFRSEIERKVKQMHIIQGEINQLKMNEKVIMGLIENMVAAAERDIARQETMSKLKDAREVQAERRAALKDKVVNEQEDK